MARSGRSRPFALAAARRNARATSYLALTGALVLAGHGGSVMAQDTPPPESPVAGIPDLPTTIDPVAVEPVEAVDPVEPDPVEPVADSTAVDPTAAGPTVVEPVDPVGAENVIPDAIEPATTIQNRAARLNPATPAPAGRQSPPSGPVLTFDVGAGLVLEDGDLSNRNSLGFSYQTQTREQSLRLSLGSSFDIDGSGIDTDDTFPDADFAYVRDTGVLLLRLSGFYSVAEIDGRIPGPDFEFDETDLVRDSGRRETTQLAFGFELGQRDPIGLEFGATYQARNYRGIDDPDLTDTRDLIYRGALRFTLDPTLTFRLTALESDVQKGGGTDIDERETAYGARVTWQARPTTEVDLSLSRSRVETEQNETIAVIDPVTGDLLRIPTGDRQNSVRTGLVGDLAVTQQLPNGTLGGRIARELTSNGDLDRISVSRRLNLANGSDLSLTFGIASFDGSDVFPIANLRYVQPLPTGQLTASLQSDGYVDNDDQNVSRTRASLGYTQPLTPLSNLSLSLGVVSINVLDGLEEDTVAADLLIDYDQQLAQNWSLNVGYQGTASRQDGTDNDSDNTVFVNLNRSFTFRP